MAWEKRFREYGVLKIDKNNVRVHSGPQQYDSIYINEGGITNALWAGDSIVVYLANNKIRRYTASQTYQNVN